MSEMRNFKLLLSLLFSPNCIFKLSCILFKSFSFCLKCPSVFNVMLVFISCVVRCLGEINVGMFLLCDVVLQNDPFCNVMFLLREKEFNQPDTLSNIIYDPEFSFMMFIECVWVYQFFTSV